MVENKKENYLAILKEHVLNYQELLSELTLKVKSESLTKFDYLAAERLLQVLVEAAVGFAKQWVKASNINVAANAYDDFKILQQTLGKITEDELDIWKRIIGLRNTLVHDYLNIDLRIIKKIIENKQYLFISNFILDNLTQVNL